MHRDIGKLPTFEFLPGPTIINIDNDPNGNGTHWVVLYRIPRRFCYYFDPIGEKYGGYPPPAVRDWVREPLYMNKVSYQPPKSFLCGYFAIYVSLKLRGYKPMSPSDVDYIITASFGKNADVTDILKVIQV